MSVCTEGLNISANTYSSYAFYFQEMVIQFQIFKMVHKPPKSLTHLSFSKTNAALFPSQCKLAQTTIIHQSTHEKSVLKAYFQQSSLQKDLDILQKLTRYSSKMTEVIFPKWQVYIFTFLGDKSREAPRKPAAGVSKSRLFPVSFMHIQCTWRKYKTLPFQACLPYI